MRTFIALELPERFVDELAGLSRQLSACVEGRIMRRETFHVTLAFLGETGEGVVRRAMDALDDACDEAGPVPLRPTGLGHFGSPRDATLWLGLADDPGLMDLAARLRAALRDRDVPFDGKAFRPHITLARRARLPRGAMADLAFPLPADAVRATLFRSILDSSGAIYKPLYSVSLA